MLISTLAIFGVGPWRPGPENPPPRWQDPLGTFLENLVGCIVGSSSLVMQAAPDPTNKNVTHVQRHRRMYELYIISSCFPSVDFHLFGEETSFISCTRFFHSNSLFRGRVISSWCLARVGTRRSSAFVLMWVLFLACPCYVDGVPVLLFAFRLRYSVLGRGLVGRIDPGSFFISLMRFVVLVSFVHVVALFK